MNEPNDKIASDLGIFNLSRKRRPRLNDSDCINEISNIMHSWEPKPSNTPAGITYLGQMIAHDLTNSDAENNFYPPYLNLNSVYGVKQNQYDVLFDDEGYFKFGINLTKTRSKYQYLDLPRNQKNGMALIAHQRNDNNFIISQLHLLWMNFHNKLLFENAEELPKNKRKRIDSVRHFVTLVFHKTVKDEYIKYIIHPDILKYYNNPKHTVLFNIDNLNKAPNVFSKSVFRFGHSMVRSHYELNETHKSESLRELFNHVENKGRPNWKPISLSKIFSWSQFFSSKHLESKNKASMINLSLTKHMQNVPTSRGNIDITRNNIEAGENKGNEPSVPSAQEILEYLNSHHPNYVKTIGLTLDLIDFPMQLKKLGLDQVNLPLWLYILNEAFLDNSKNSEGDKLGRLGSCIVIEVLLNAIRHSDFLPKDIKSNKLNWSKGMLSLWETIERLDDSVILYLEQYLRIKHQ